MELLRSTCMSRNSLVHHVRRKITFLACDLNVLFSLFKTAFGKRSMSNDKVMYLTATSQARGNGAYVYADIFFTFKIILFILNSSHFKACKTLPSSYQCNLFIVDLHWLKFVKIIKKKNINKIYLIFILL